MGDLVSGLQRAMDSALGALGSGDAVDAERSAKAISALAKAARDVNELAAQASAAEPEYDVDALRAELHRRLDRFVAEAEAGAPDAVLERIASESLSGRVEGMGPRGAARA